MRVLLHHITESDINMQDSDGRTPLICATIEGHEESQKCPLNTITNEQTIKKESKESKMVRESGLTLGLNFIYIFPVSG